MRHFLQRLHLPTILAILAISAGACADPSRPVRATAPEKPSAIITYYDADYATSGVLTSSGDTCPNFAVPSIVADPFWSGADEQRVQNPDSIATADSLTKGDTSYTAPLAVLDPWTGAELQAGNCEVLYNRCVAGCRRLGTRRARAVCYAGCMARYAQCLADEAARKYLPPPTQCPAYDTQLIYDPGDPAYSSGTCGGSGGGGDGETGGSGGGRGSCATELVTIEINDGTGWRTYWQGYAIVCG